MIICTPSNDDELVFRKRALRDAILCMGWLKVVSVVCYITMYFFVHSYSNGPVSTTLQIMLCLIIPFLILHAILLFLGALEEQTLALNISLWLCLIIAAYNTVLGLIGAVYFIRTGFSPVHFILAAAFALMALSLLTVICHDVIIVYSYKQLLTRGDNAGTCCYSISSNSSAKPCPKV